MFLPQSDDKSLRSYLWTDVKLCKLMSFILKLNQSVWFGSVRLQWEKIVHEVGVFHLHLYEKILDVNRRFVLFLVTISGRHKEEKKKRRNMNIYAGSVM